MQPEMLLFLMKRGGHLWTLEENWTHVGVLRSHSAESADCNWSASCISVSYCLQN